MILMPHFTLDYDIAGFYQVIDDLFKAFGPILYFVIGVGLAVLVISGIAHIIARIRGDE